MVVPGAPTCRWSSYYLTSVPQVVPPVAAEAAGSGRYRRASPSDGRPAYLVQPLDEVLGLAAGDSSHQVGEESRRTASRQVLPADSPRSPRHRRLEVLTSDVG